LSVDVIKDCQPTRH